MTLTIRKDQITQDLWKTRLGRTGGGEKKCQGWKKAFCGWKLNGISVGDIYEFGFVSRKSRTCVFIRGKKMMLFRTHGALNGNSWEGKWKIKFYFGSGWGGLRLCHKLQFHAQTASQHKSAALKGEIYLRVSRRERANPIIIELFQLHSQQEP